MSGGDTHTVAKRPIEFVNECFMFTGSPVNVSQCSSGNDLVKDRRARAAAAGKWGSTLGRGETALKLRTEKTR